MANYDYIKISNLHLNIIIGVNAIERIERQDVFVDIWIYFNSQKANLSDKLEDTVDYFKIEENIIKKFSDSSFFLIEKLAKEIMNLVLSNPLVENCRVTVNKPNALQKAKNVSFTTSYINE